MRISLLHRVFVVALLAASAPTQAQDSDSPSFFVRGGAFLSEMQTMVRVDAVNGDGRDRTRLRARFRAGQEHDHILFEAGWCCSDNWDVAIEYFGINRSSTAAIDRPINVGETSYPVNAKITGSFRSNLYTAQLSWSAYRAQNAEFDLTVGAHVTDVLIAVEGNGSVGGGRLQPRHERKRWLGSSEQPCAIANWRVCWLHAAARRVCLKHT